MKWLLAVRRHGQVSVVTAASVGVVTNLATSAFSWALVAALVALVVVQAGLSLRQDVQDDRGRQAARDLLLGPLRPSVPDPPVSNGSPIADAESNAREVVHWLAAPFSPTPLWGRKTVHDQLVAWCVDRDPAAGVVRVLTGPAGVGKSRLALAVAESLPTGWVAGRLLGSGDGLVERIDAAGDPTLVLVDDADRVPGLDILITRAARQPGLIRLLLLTRTEASLRSLPDTVLPQVTRTVALTPIGEAADRQRWFTQAVRAYARALRVPPPDLSDRPVGHDEDTLLVLHARALLAVLGRAGTRTWSLADIATELVGLETRTWDTDLPRLPAGCDADVLAEAVTVLLLLPAPTPEEAAELLWRVPQLAHDTAHQSRVAVARWAYRRYPPGPDHRLDLRPHLVAERLLLNTLTQTRHLLHDDDIPTAAPVLAHAYATFPDAIDALTPVLAPLHTRRQALLPSTLAAILATGVTLDHTLASLINPDSILDSLSGDIETFAQLLRLNPPTTFPHLVVAHSRLVVAAYRRLAETKLDQCRPDLASSLHSLGNRLYEVGRHREALTVTEEAVAYYRELVETEPDRYRPDLAGSLHSLGNRLCEVGRHREALTVTEEAVAYYRELVETEPDRYRPDLAGSLHSLGNRLYEVGRHREALTVTEEAIAIRQELVETEPDRYRPDLADSLHNLGHQLGVAGRHREALTVTEEAVAIGRELVETEPDRYRPDLAISLHNLGHQLDVAGRHREALTVTEEAVAYYRELVETEPARYRPDLAISLNSLGNCLYGVGRHREALTATEEAVAIRRDLVETEPDRYRPDLAGTLTSLGHKLDAVGRHREALTVTEEAVTCYRELVKTESDRHRPDLAGSLHNLGHQLDVAGRHREALTVTQEAVAIRRELVETEPDRRRPDLANSLQNLAILKKAGDPDAALDALHEAVAVRKACAERDPELHGPLYRQALAELCRWLDLAGRHEEAATLALDSDSPGGTHPEDRQPDTDAQMTPPL